MQINVPHIIRLTVVLSLVGLAVAGCGRKGDLDPPSAQATKGGDRQPADASSRERRTSLSSSIRFFEQVLAREPFPVPRRHPPRRRRCPA